MDCINRRRTRRPRARKRKRKFQQTSFLGSVRKLDAHGGSSVKPVQKVLGGRGSVKVAVIQTPPVFLDREKSVDRACNKIAEAARQGAELVAFTEPWLAGYPYWGEGWQTELQKWLPVRVRFYDNAVLIPSEDTERLCHAAAKANTHVVIGCNEMDSRPGVHTIYNTLLFIDRSGRILGRHRKTVPR